jgi:Caspase domain
MGSVAVCCGFNHYEHVPSLAGAMNDAVHPYAELTTNPAFNADPGLARIGHVFSQKTTSADEVLAAFARAAGSSAELVWFSFSGHAVISDRGELHLLLPTWRGDGSEEDRHRRSIAARDLEDVMRPHLPYKKLVIVIDACFSGAFRGAALTRDIQPALDGRMVRTISAPAMATTARPIRGTAGSAPRARSPAR